MATAATPSVADFDPRSRRYFLDPQAVVQGLFDEGAAVFFSEVLNAYYLMPHEVVRQALRDAETYSSHAFKGMPVPERLRGRIPHEWERVGALVQGSQLVNTDPPAHTPRRRALQRGFTLRRVDGVKPSIAAIANELIDELIDSGGCDLMKDFALRLAVRVAGTMLALPQDLIPGFLAWIGDVFTVQAPITLDAEDVRIADDELVATFERLHSAQAVYLDLLEERRARPGDDLASALLTLEDERGEPVFTTDQVLAHMVGLTAAGTDTTAALITNMVRCFTQEPEQLEVLRGDPALWGNAIQEGLRRSSSAMHSLRISTRESEIAGVRVPAGSNVCISLAAANADPAKFSDPLRFDVRRPNAADQLGLGIGRHYCLGAPLAPPEARIALELLYQRLPNLRADLDQELEFVPSPSARIMLSQRVTW